MILIFGGTTEGRIAAEVCDEAGKRFFYSTKGDQQHLETHNGVRLTGAMSAEELQRFCKNNGIRCIVNAAHPFADNLHKAIGLSGVPVVRLQRKFAKPIDGVCYCADYADAVAKMEAAGLKHLLALSGVGTIAKIEGYWRRHNTTFRILDRQDSLDRCAAAGFPLTGVIFYNEDNHLPTKDEEKATMLSLGCDAILTKESGATGGFEAKVRAALEIGARVFVVRRPALPDSWTVVTGRHGLRRAIERLVADFFELKTGLTTGACATAAAKAAMLSLLWDDESEEVAFDLPDGETLTIPVEHKAKGVACVTKDQSDDPDVTRGCRITVSVAIRKNGNEANGMAHNDGTNGDSGDSSQHVRFLQGEGVGTVTLPGLGIPVGEPAVNPTPRRMIESEIACLTDKCVDVTISVGGGEELAKRTFNQRVGVMGGISILGTSGIVRPLSNEAFMRSVRRELEVAWAIGKREIGLVAGMKSEKALMAESDIRCVHYGNFIGETLKAAHDIGFRRAVLAIMIGKAVKLADGHLDTHSHKVAMDKDFLRQVAKSLSIPTQPIDGITMARELWGVMPKEFFNKITSLCREHCMTVFPDGEIDVRLICDTPQQ